MIKNRKFRLFSISVLISIISLTNANAENLIVDSGGKILPPTGDQYQVTFNQLTDAAIGSHFSYQVKPSTDKNPARPLPHYSALLPACTSPTESTCIELVESRKIGETTWVAGTLSKNQFDVSKIEKPKFENFYEYGNWPADKKNEIAAGGVASSWDLPKTPHTGGFSYIAGVNFTGQFALETKMAEFSVMLEPWSWRCVEYDTCNFIGMAAGETAVNFQPNSEFRITIRMNFLTNKIGTWAVGRLDKPTVSNQIEKLIVSGSPVVYPMGYATLNTRSECSEKLEPIFTKLLPYSPKLCTYSAMGFSTKSNDALALPLFDALEAAVKQNGQVARWTFTANKSKDANSECEDPKNFSLATSNAMLYSVTPPVWDKKNGTLNYRLASTHLDSKGNLNKGNYSLAISKKRADCLWNFDTAKASATISITNSEGTQNIAISSLRTSKDWIYFDASGFTFSAPEIKVKLINNAAKAATKSITCTKGKQNKKVSGVSPKCPTGFKLKK